MKSLLKALLRRLGIIVMKRSSRVYLPEDESSQIALALCGKTDPVIIDGGAHRGAMVDAFRAIVPHARFHCFEPDPDLATELADRFSSDDKVHVIAAALGAEPDKMVFNLNASRATNSILQTASGIQEDLETLGATVRQVDVAVTTIDHYCKDAGADRIDIIKLDLQGYDYQALLGAKSVIRGARVVIVEVWFSEVYRGCHLFPDILQLMVDYGFKLYTLSGIHYGVDDELLWADAVFERKR